MDDGYMAHVVALLNKLKNQYFDFLGTFAKACCHAET